MSVSPPLHINEVEIRLQGLALDLWLHCGTVLTYQTPARIDRSLTRMLYIVSRWFITVYDITVIATWSR